MQYYIKCRKLHEILRMHQGPQFLHNTTTTAPLRRVTPLDSMTGTGSLKCQQIIAKFIYLWVCQPEVHSREARKIDDTIMLMQPRL